MTGVTFCYSSDIATRVAALAEPLGGAQLRASRFSDWGEPAGGSGLPLFHLTGLIKSARTELLAARCEYGDSSDLGRSPS